MSSTPLTIIFKKFTYGIIYHGEIKFLLLNLEPTLINFNVRPGNEKGQKKFGKRICTFCNFESVETKKNFILECDAFKDNRDKFVNILTDSTWFNLFSEEYIEKLGALIINLHKQRTDLQKLILIG